MNDATRAILASMEEDTKARREKEFADWCSHLEGLPPDYEPALKDGLKADIELQPHRWMALGMDLLQSSKGTIALQLIDDQPGPYLGSFLAYPIFQMGSEIFLKGMWLCQFPDCRALGQLAYMDMQTRKNYQGKLSALSHDLLKIIEAVRQVPKYQADPTTLRFLKIVEGVIRQYYFPLYAADKHGRHWAHSRYPKRFFNDTTRDGRADAFQSYPQQSLIVKLFRPMEDHVDKLWGLRAGLCT
jgi:hypothetical protein